MLLVGAYLLGSFPTGGVVARAYGVDLTEVGSRRTGATNALRVLGKRAAIAVLLVDAGKGLAAVVLARRFGSSSAVAPAAALVAMVGHTYSLFLKGRGGRGVATGLGGLLGLSTGATVAGVAGAVITIAATRFVSLGSLVGAAIGGLALIAQARRGRVPGSYGLAGLLGPLFLTYTHRDNLERLLGGTERRLGEGAQAEPRP
jgi:glycerol-3-phosphate acyltransferase PlsY